jgi:predicted Zn-dependent peptidase
MPNKHFSAHCFFCLASMALLVLSGPRPLAAETRQFSFLTSKGLNIKVLQDNSLPFVHAQLLVFLKGRSQNYTSLVISQLTIMNMFEEELNSPPANLLAMLKRQGNDFQIEQNPEYIKISMSFLPDRLASFSKLLKEIFNYQSFHLNKFNESKANFWTFFSKNRDWKKEIAFLLAYQEMVGNFFFSQGYLLQGVLNKINLAQLRSFILETFRPDNALLILKGSVNPYFILGMIEKDLPPPAPLPAKPKNEEIVINPGRKVFVLNVDSSEPPSAYWFDAAPAASDASYLPFLIGNFVLFGFPGGRIYQAEKNQFRMGSYKVNSEIFSLKYFSVSCNYLRLNYDDMENFIMLVDQEKKRFYTRPLERKEYLDALNFYFGQAQVNTGRFDNDFQGEIDRFFALASGALPPRSGLELFQEVSFNRVLQVMDEQMGSRYRPLIREKGVIVLVGKANLIMDQLKTIKAELIELRVD